MSVLLSAVDELRLQLIQLLLEFLTHGLTQRVTLTTGEVGKQARQEHHLLLIYGDTVCVLEVLLHARDIVLHK